MAKTRSSWAGSSALLLGLVSACGGGGGGGGAVGAAPTAPDVALFVVSGHAFDGVVSASYLALDAGPAITAELTAAGRSVATSYYVDDPQAVDGVGGYVDLLDDLIFTLHSWVPQGTRVVVVAHSHGGVWAHEAIRAVPELSIEALIDLDCTSYAWSLVGHGGDNRYIGGDPRDAFAIDGVTVVPDYPTVPSDPSGLYDVEDVVFPNVAHDLEIRSGDAAPFAFEWYDDAWNVRLDGSDVGITHRYTGTDHAEVHDPRGTTIPYVVAWLRARLGV